MFRHVVLLRWTSQATAAQRSAVAVGLAELPRLIPEIHNYEIGSDAHLNDGNFDLVIVADFADVDGYLVYRDHPDHQAVIRERIQPILADRAAVQYEM
ncbi:MAG: Dabb family protein [Acidimicrobiia bacterium]